MDANLERLRSIKSFPSLVKYLRDELDWPIESEDVENLSFDYQPEELGLDAKTAVKIKEIKQLRPFVTNQPWGIFYVNFEPKRLPIVALRRILRSLVIKKRGSANKAQQRAWQQNDLLFISSYGETDEREITFAHFSEDSVMGDLPTLKVLGWSAGNTVLRLEDTHSTLKDKLHWPEDEDDTKEWRERWSSAFKLQYRETVRTSKELAVNLAELAGDIRARVNAVLAVESKHGESRKLYQAFQEALIHDLDEDDFADMYAQTIAYGLLTASISRQSGGLVADNLKDMVPNTNPFLKELMQTFLTVGGRKGKIDFDELGINEVVELLRHTQMDEVLRDFGAKNPQEDPVIHFYELFLKEYDPEKRMKRGVFYTPRPVVSFIVRSVDEILRTEFGLEDGLADTTTWGEMAARNFVGADLRVRPNEEERPDEQGQTQSSAPTIDFKIPDGVKPDEPFVQILDPATGTGTFLVEVIDRIYETLRAKWKREGKSARELDELWNDYVPRHLLPRLHGFELMMAPYSIAHMKIGLKLRETHYSFLSSERARIYLTNTLEEPKDFSSYFEQMAPALAHEAQSVNNIKRHQSFTVVIGNPPYAGASLNYGQWISRLLEEYYIVDGKPLGEKNPRYLQDDYVKFVRFGQQRLRESQAGVFSFISNHGYLKNPTFRGMRQSLINEFPIWKSLDLHGNVKKRERCPDGSIDENVFDIQQGVAIFQATKGSGFLRSLKHGHLYGDRATKYKTLETSSMTTISGEDVSAVSPFYLLEPQDADVRAEYYRFTSLAELMPLKNYGFKTHRDDFAISFDKGEITARVNALRSKDCSDAEILSGYDLSETVDWKIETCRRHLRENKNWKEPIRRCCYRPFDYRYCYLSSDMMDRPRFPFINQMLEKNLALATTRTVEIQRGFEHIGCVRLPMDHHAVSLKESNFLFPLYIYSAAGALGLNSRPSPNFSRAILDTLGSSLGLPFDRLQGQGSDTKAEDIFHYVYAQLHSPAYRRRYSDFLKIDFPRVALISDVELFFKLCALGADVVALHLLEDEYEAASWNTFKSKGKSPLKTLITRFAGKGEAEVAKGYPKYKDGNVHINSSRYFEGVPEEVWNFHIGGYQVCEKWLKDRRGRTLSDEDVNHYQRVVVALNETIRLMAEIDRVIEEHGGWPLVGSQDTPKAETASNLPFS